MKTAGVSPMRLVEMLADRFGVFEAVAHSTILLSRCPEADDLVMDVRVAEAVLEFGTDLREARDATVEWARAKNLIPR